MLVMQLRKFRFILRTSVTTRFLEFPNIKFLLPYKEEFSSCCQFIHICFLLFFILKANMRACLLLLLVCLVEMALSSPQSFPVQPPAGQRCRGRNYGERRCCTPQNPCGLGEGDCDGQLDGGKHDGNDGCRAGLVCGSNNCRRFGLYYHKKDDCCEYPSESWSQWTTYGPCYNGKKTRTRSCHGSACARYTQTQDRICYTENGYNSMYSDAILFPTSGPG